MIHKKISDHALAFVLVGISSLLFAGFESQIQVLTNKLSVDLYIGVRLVGTTILFGLIYQVLRRSDKTPLTLNPERLDRFIWARGALMVVYLATSTIAFSCSRSQASVYAFLFTTPVWQIVATRVIKGTWPPYRHQIGPVAALLAGVFLYAFHGGARFHAFEWTHVYTPALIAGIAFAFFLVVGKLAPKGNALALTFHTTYATLLLCVLALPLLHWLLPHIGLHAGTMAMLRLPPETIARLTGGCVALALATWALTEAFERTNDETAIAAADTTTLPLGASFDIVSGQISTAQTGFPAIVTAVVVIFAGAVWSARAHAVNAWLKRLWNRLTKR